MNAVIATALRTLGDHDRRQTADAPPAHRAGEVGEPPAERGRETEDHPGRDFREGVDGDRAPFAHEQRVRLERREPIAQVVR